MEGVGSRQSRASSRYGSSPAAPVFSGPVRKWKKQWVSSRPTNTSGNNRNDGPPLLLCRWTPLSTSADEPRKRRFRYTPVVPIEKGDTESVEKLRNEDKLSERNQTKGFRNGSDASNGDISTEETQMKFRYVIVDILYFNAPKIHSDKIEVKLQSIISKPWIPASELSEDQSDSNKITVDGLFSKEKKKRDR